MVRVVLICGMVLMLGCDGLEESSSSEAIAETPAQTGKGDNAEQMQSDTLEEPEEPAAEDEKAVLDEDHPWVVDGEDICETFGLYDDETCDSHCPLVDPVCPESAYEEEVVEEEVVNCESEALECAEGESGVDTDQSGCPDTCVEAGVGCAGNLDCAEGYYCSRPDGECDAALGVCTEVPDCGELDTETFIPEFVCGCDGYTYISPCDAYYGSANIDYAGMCEYDED